MKIMTAFSSALDALQASKQLANAQAWKQAQVWANLLAALVVLVGAVWKPLGISQADILTVAGGLAALGNIYLTVATTKTIGLREAPKSRPFQAAPMAPDPDPGPGLDDPELRGVPGTVPDADQNNYRRIMGDN